MTKTSALFALAPALALAATALSPATAESQAPDILGVAVAEGDGRTLRAIYNGYFIGLRVMKASIDAEMQPEAYSAAAVFRAAGLAGFFNDSEIHANIRGDRAGNDLSPARYDHANLKSKRNRTMVIDFTGPTVQSIVTPPFGSMGQPPATDEQRREALDPISALLTMGLPVSGSPCQGSVPVFDGKQRYDLRLEARGEETVSLRGYRGRAHRCDLYYVPIAGYDPEDLADPEVYARPFQIWLANAGGETLVPVRIVGNVNGLRISVEATTVRWS